MTLELPQKPMRKKESPQLSLKTFFQKGSFDVEKNNGVNEEDSNELKGIASANASKTLKHDNSRKNSQLERDQTDQIPIQKKANLKQIKKDNAEIIPELDTNCVLSDSGNQKFIKGFVGRAELYGKKIKEVIGQIRELEKDRTDFLHFFEQNFVNNPDVDLRLYKINQQPVFLEEKIRYPVSEKILKNVSILASDAGVASSKYLGFEFSLISVALTHFEYKNDQINEVVYYPDHDDGSYGIVFNGSHRSDSDIEVFTSLERAYAEITSIISFLKKYPEKKVHLIILDGSLRIEPYRDLFKENRKYLMKYAEVLNQYETLYTLCQRKKILLVGSVKNSESVEFRENINRAFPTFIKLFPSLNVFHKIRYRDLLEDFNDSYFLYRTLDINQRSCVYRLNSRSTDSGIVPGISQSKPTSLLQESRQYLCFYLQVVPFEAPLKIEFLFDSSLFDGIDRFKGLSELAKISSVADQISGLLLPLANKMGVSSLPIPQIEAHNRATLTLNEFKILEEEVKNKYIIDLMERFNEEEKKSRSEQGQIEDLSEMINMKKEHLKEFMGVFIQRRRSTPL
jgi:hypothetical protein